MSAFEVNVTPTRLKNLKRRDEAREPTYVLLAPFSPRATVAFEDIPVTKTARRFLILKNPSECEIKVTLTKTIKDECNATIEWTSNTIPSNTEISFEITWSPLKEMCSKETLQFTDDRGFKKDVSVILKSIDKNLTKKLLIKSVPVVTKKLKLKGPSPPKRISTKRSPLRLKTTRTSSSAVLITKKVEVQSTFVEQKIDIEIKSPLRSRNPFDSYNFSNIGQDFFGSEFRSAKKQNKENCSPKTATTPTNASSIFDRIQFTPATDKKGSLEYLASLPTPVGNYNSESIVERTELTCRKFLTSPLSDESMNFKNEIMETPRPSELTNVSHFYPDICSTVTKNEIKFIIENFDEDEFDSDSRKKLFNNSGYLERLSSETYVTCPISPQSFNDTKTETSPTRIEHYHTARNFTLNKTHSVTPPPLSMILEEEGSQDFGSTFLQKNNKTLQKTFQISVNNTPLRKVISESCHDLSRENIKSETKNLRFNQGSMPNLADIDQNINSIENNRYFYQTIGKSSHDVMFEANEICAQSSRFNLNEIEEKDLIGCGGEDSTKSIGLSPKSDFTNKKPIKRMREKESPRNEVFRRPKQLKSAAMIISPPKRRLIDFKNISQNSTQSTRGQNINTTKWGAVQPKKLKIPKVPMILSLKKKIVTPRKEQERVILFDSELFLQGVINPDPFAATTTCDPFLATTMYLDEQSVDRHERHFKKWLNALVTIPAELDSEINQKIDFGRLFNEVKNKDLILAETKEKASAKYLTKYRMDSLRKTAVQLFHSLELREPLAKIATQIEKKLLCIRDDRDLHLDLVLQRHVLELLLCFNPLWLRIGLEVVYGEQINLNSNSDVVGLSSFIINRLFKDKFLEAKYSKAYQYSSTYSEQIKKFSLKKFLFLMLFLDTAKHKKLIKHNPCLFVKASPYKETREILIKYSSHMIANIGDITKHLKRLGYILTHKQSYIDEFDYAFNNLAVDLRDGVRLTRVMEIILLREDLTKSLRVPAISSLQRVHNVDLGLKALAEANFVITGDITARDISDGHREKTLSILWQIIYKFRAPKFNKAATLLQMWWRNSWLKVVINRRIKEKEEIRRKLAAVKIQTYYRGYISRKHTKIIRNEKNRACIVLQKYFRRFLSVKKFQKQIRSVHLIQKWYRSVYVAREYRIRYIIKRTTTIKIQTWYRRIILARKLEKAAPLIKELKETAKIRHEKAIFLQKTIRSYLIRKRFRETVEGVVRFYKKRNLKGTSATTIQSYYRMIVVRREFLKIKTKTILIQKWWRWKSEGRSARNQFLLIQKSVRIIQNQLRSCLLMRCERNEFLNLRKSVCCVQQRFRANSAMKIDRENYLKIQTSVILIQNMFRCHLKRKLVRNQFLIIKKSVLTIQVHLRSFILMKSVRSEFLEIRQNVLNIQRRFKANLQRNQFLLLKKSTILIQQKYRAILESRKQRNQFLILKKSILIIQRQFRAQILMKSERCEFIELRKSVLLIQRQFRANKLMKEQRNEFLRLKTCSIYIQRQFRGLILMKRQKLDYENLKKSVIIFQQRFRAKITMIEKRTDYLRVKEASITIQRQFRAQILMKSERNRFLSLKKAVITIQRKLRATFTMRTGKIEFVTLQYSVTIVQRQFRSNILMKNQRNYFLKLKQTVIRIQRIFRGRIKTRNCVENYETLKRSTICIQQHLRATILMRRERNEYLNLKKSTILIQQQFRSILIMRKELRIYQTIKIQTIVIQTYFRSYQLMKKERMEFLTLKKSVQSIQQRFRANLMMKNQRNQFLLLRQSVVKIQTRFRAKLLMKKQRFVYLTLQKHVLTIQSYFLANQQMKIERFRFLSIKNSTIFIQQKLKATILMRKQQRNYLQIKSAVLTIQKHFRAKLLQRIERKKYLLIKKSIITIQQRFRAYSLMKQQRNQFLLIQKAVLIIQTKLRAQLLMKQQQIRYNQLRNSSLVIQSYLRATLLMREERKTYLLIMKSTIFIQIKYKSNLLMIKERDSFLHKKQAAIKIQKYFRCYQKMKIEREEFLNLKKSVIKIQQKYRAHYLMKQIRNQYLLIKSLVIVIQRKWRFKKIMEAKQRQIIELRTSVLFVQRFFRGKLQMRLERQRFLDTRDLILRFQAYARGYLGRRNYEKLLTPEMLEIRRRNNAAKKIQAYWRGHNLRRKRQTKKMKQLSTKLTNLRKVVQKSDTLRSILKSSLTFLKGRFNVLEAIRVLTRLDNITRVVPHIVVENAEFIATFCYGIMAQSIRSEPDKILIELCSRVILNLARFEETKSKAFQNGEGLVTISQMLLRWSDKDCGIFNTLCTLIWVFAHSQRYNRIIRQFMTSGEAIYMLRESKKLLLRKERMKKNAKRLTVAIYISGHKNGTMPSLEPDFGVNKQYPYVFENFVYAFDTILEKLNVSIV